MTAERDAPLQPRIQAIIEALKLLPEYLQQDQWLADERQLFGERWVRSVVGDNGSGTGRQAIASVPQHLTGLAHYIAAVNPNTIKMLIASAPDMATRITALEAREAELVDALAAIENAWIKNNAEGGDYEKGYDDGLREACDIARATLTKHQEGE